MNTRYIVTCACGNTKYENEKPIVVIKPLQNTEEIQTDQSDNFEKIKKFKELFDSGIITEEEFERKKRQLLDL